MELNHHLTSPDSPKSLGPSETSRLNTENLCVCLVNNEAPPSLREERYPMDAFNGRWCYSARGSMMKAVEKEPNHQRSTCPLELHAYQSMGQCCLWDQ